MKVHDNSAFRWVVVILWPNVNFFKTKGLVAFPSGSVGFADFEKNHPFTCLRQHGEQRRGYALPAMLRGDGEVQNLDLVGRDVPGYQESNDVAGQFGDGYIISRGVPRGGFGTGLLNRGDGHTVVVSGGTDKHYFLGA